MNQTTKQVSIGYPRQPNEIKVTFPGGIVNIHCGLRDREGRAVVSVSVSADGDRYAGDPQWWAHWGETDAKGGGVRIIQHEHVNVGAGECFICHHYGEDCTGVAPKQTEVA